MDACCAATVRQHQRYVLQLVLAVNVTMFCVEFGAGLVARSTALLGDSLDMFGDTLVYAFSLYVLNKDRAWRARSALIKGGVMLAFGVGVFVTAIVRLQAGGIPLVPAMMGIGALALVANAFCFALLWRHRTSDLNLRSTWLCSRNDLVANGAVYQHLAQEYANFDNFLFLGRGINAPIATEGALKLKEISYIHAEAYPAGEMKHGPIALIDNAMATVALAPRDSLYDKNVNNVKEVKARDGRVLAVLTEGDSQLSADVDHALYIPEAPEHLIPLLITVPLQMLAYHIALLRDRDVDQPRNLAKSVTVE